ncbi:MAG: GNAT family N-acetyltransferase [Geodermatophilaceae bacterium]|nr:GNAT family N-acetyltransferase [Geodermatophilaceae bacterium]
MTRYDVRPSTAADVALLEAAMPSRGLDVHRHFHDEQDNGDITYLTVWADTEPVGSGVISWLGPHLPPGALDTHPELKNVGVAPQWRGRGAGTRLIRSAIDVIRDRGCAGVSLGVSVDNDGAARLYERLGFWDTGVRETTAYRYPDDDGVMQDVVEQDRLLRLDF